jgi:hypothetical protein
MLVEMDQELERSTGVPNGVGKVVEFKSETNEDLVEVGLTHSSLRAGKPSTWQRG